MSIGTQIAERRKGLGMTQLFLAQRLSVSVQTVSSWEQEENLPETELLKPLAKVLQTTVSYLMEEEMESVRQWELHDAMFSVENMLRRVNMYAESKKMPETQKAIKIMLKYHDGAVRKSRKGETIPYVIHPLMMACHAFALGIDEDDLIATILLHDVIEDTDATYEDLGVNERIQEAVRLVTFEMIEGMTKEESKKRYYEELSKDKIAAMVKLLDRCNNVSTMATGFNSEKMAEYIEETQNYVFPVLDWVKHEYDDYYDAAFLLKYQLLSVMESLKRTL